MHRRNMYPNIWKSFGRFPSFFNEEVEDLLPEIRELSNERELSISESPGEFRVEAPVPGLSPENIEISFDKGVLWIKGKSWEEETDKERKYYQKAVRSYSYCTSLPESVDMESEPDATCSNGIITITFKKKEPSAPKKIKIRQG